MPDTYEIGESVFLTCYKCGGTSNNLVDVELRKCSHCGTYHLEHLKPIETRAALEAAVVKTAVALHTILDLHTRAVNKLAAFDD